MRYRLMLSLMSAFAASAVTKRFFRNILEIIRASNSKIYRNVANSSLSISAGMDVTNYFWSTANRTNVSILGHVPVTISR